MKTGTFVMLRKKNNGDFVCFMLFFQFSRECVFFSFFSFNKIYFSGARTFSNNNSKALFVCLKNRFEGWEILEQELELWNKNTLFGSVTLATYNPWIRPASGSTTPVKSVSRPVVSWNLTSPIDLIRSWPEIRIWSESWAPWDKSNERQWIDIIWWNVFLKLTFGLAFW